ncbi:unnamed protein product [Leptidea sinapis]|uniref:Uncharacterized protein n=1 Tax=Leptidea sinapis TaxID=189913 RepID=A0A5E4Q6S6_9NEOP|nr:unnamed protein product [Leptidea sinapis]
MWGIYSSLDISPEKITLTPGGDHNVKAGM